MTESNIFEYLKNLIKESLKKNFALSDLPTDHITIEIPKSAEHGDLSTNIAMILGKKLSLNSRKLGEYISEDLKNNPIFFDINIAGPGFINFKFTDKFWQNILKNIIVSEENFGKINLGNKRKINLEFVSANPTGPLHIGHARGAIYGDALARVLEFCNYYVCREYYVNDAGGQIAILSKSAFIRYQEIVYKKEIDIPEGLYPGEYLKEFANELYNELGDSLIKVNENEALEIITTKVINFNISKIKKDLKDIQVFHDVFFSEKSMSENNQIQKAIDILKSKNLIYEGILETPKGEVNEEWVQRNQPLFKSTEFGDDNDRAIIKSDGSYTYFAGDIGYAYDKIIRGFKKNIIILGFDHAGYVKRIESIYKSLGDSDIKVKLCQMVNFVKNGEPIKMSKRSGNYTTVSDVINEISPDILRFVMLTRKNDVILDFDLDLVKSHSKDNPVFYVQYAQVRANSVLDNCKENFREAFEIFASGNYDLSLITSSKEIGLIKLMSQFPKIIESACVSYEVHKIVYYLELLSSEFHSFWNAGKEYENLKLILYDNPDLTAARMALIFALRNLIRNGLKIIGVKYSERM